MTRFITGKIETKDGKNYYYNITKDKKIWIHEAFRDKNYGYITGPDRALLTTSNYNHVLTPRIGSYVFYLEAKGFLYIKSSNAKVFNITSEYSKNRRLFITSDKPYIHYSINGEDKVLVMKDENEMYITDDVVKYDEELKRSLS